MPQPSAGDRLLTCGLVALLALIAPYGTQALAGKTPALTPMVLVPVGPFIMGSTPEERGYGYQLDEQRGSSVARANRWFEYETRASRLLDAHLIDVYPVTNADYKAFVDATGHSLPFVTQEVWEGYRLIHGYETVRRFLKMTVLQSSPGAISLTRKQANVSFGSGNHGGYWSQKLTRGSRRGAKVIGSWLSVSLSARLMSERSGLRGVILSAARCFRGPVR